MSGRRSGFTLLEVLLALGLGALLMAGLFAAMRIQTRIARDGGREIEQAQLARSLLEMIAADIRACQPPGGDAGSRLRQAAAEMPLAQWFLFGGSSPLDEETVPLPLEAASLDRSSVFSQEGTISLTRRRRLNLGIIGDDSHLILSPHRSGGDAVELLPLREESPTTGAAVPPYGVGDRPNPTATDRFGDEGEQPGRSGFARVAYFLVRDAESSLLRGSEGPEPLVEPSTDLTGSTSVAGNDRPAVTERFLPVGELESVYGLGRLEVGSPQSEAAFRYARFAMAQLQMETEADRSTDESGDAAIAGELEGEEPTLPEPSIPIHTSVRTELIAPEVKYLRVGYYDEGGRHARWQDNDSLPRAVAIEIGFLPDVTSDRAESSASEQSVDMEDQVESEIRDPSLGPRLRLYRLTVRVPAAPAGKMKPPSGDSADAVPEGFFGNGAVSGGLGGGATP